MCRVSRRTVDFMVGVFHRVKHVRTCGRSKRDKTEREYVRLWTVVGFSGRWKSHAGGETAMREGESDFLKRTMVVSVEHIIIIIWIKYYPGKLCRQIINNLLSYLD